MPSANARPATSNASGSRRNRCVEARGQLAHDATGVTWADPGTSSRTVRSALALALVGLGLSACSLHVSKNGISGNIMGHSFSGATGKLPTGFPSDVPLPDRSRVLAGGGTSNNWDVAFAVTGSISSGTTAYESKFTSAGYTVTNVETGSPSAAGGTGSGSPSTTVTVNGAVFTAKNAAWTVQIVSASSTSSTSSGLKPGEFAINITVVPTSSVTSST